MFNIIPLVLILISLVIIITIVVRKFSVLATLDVDSIPAEKEIKFKEQIIGNRLKRSYFRYYKKFINLIAPLGKHIKNIFSWLYKKLLDFKETYNKENIKTENIPPTLEKLFSDTEELLKEEKYEEAENNLIQIVGLDSQNIKAFRKLADIYFIQKSYNESRQTLEHIVKLLESANGDLDQKEIELLGEDYKNHESYLGGIYFDMAEIDKAKEDFQEAIISINKALKKEPNNPRYLDMKLEICIINKDKLEAENTLEILKKANPENKKLEEIEEQIKAL